MSKTSFSHRVASSIEKKLWTTRTTLSGCALRTLSCYDWLQRLFSCVMSYIIKLCNLIKKFIKLLCNWFSFQAVGGIKYVVFRLSFGTACFFMELLVVRLDCVSTLNYSLECHYSVFTCHTQACWELFLCICICRVFSPAFTNTWYRVVFHLPSIKKKNQKLLYSYKWKLYVIARVSIVSKWKLRL